MAYRSPLESRLAKKTTKAIVEYRADRGRRPRHGRSVGRQGQLGAAADARRAAAAGADPFSLVAVNVDSGYKDYQHDVIASTCRERGWECRIEHTAIGEVMDDILDADDTPCSLCARLRRGVLYRIADEVGATKIALGHHLDDFVETLLLNLFFAGAAQGDAGPAGLRRRRARRDPAAGLRAGSTKRAPMPRSRSCRSSAAAVRPAAISACSDSASSA